MRKVWLLLALHKNLQNKEKYAKIKEKEPSCGGNRNAARDKEKNGHTQKPYAVPARYQKLFQAY